MASECTWAATRTSTRLPLGTGRSPTTPGRGSWNGPLPTRVLGALGRDGELRVRVVKDIRKKTIHGFLKDSVAGEAEAIYTDALKSYRGIGDADTRHEFVDHSAE